MAGLWKLPPNLPVCQSLYALQAFCDAERGNREGGSPMLLSSAMIRTMHTQATIPRDRVYALLNLSRDGRTVIPFPSYDKPDAEVFDSILRQMIITQGRLDLMFFAGSWKQDRLSPSWLPSWNERPRQSSSDLHCCTWLAACFSREPVAFDGNHVLWDQESDALVVDAQIIGTLRDKLETPDSFSHDCEQELLESHLEILGITRQRQNPSRLHMATVLVVCMRLLACESQSMDSSLTVPFQSKNIYTLLHLWSRPCVGSEPPASQLKYPELFRWYLNNKSISYLGSSLRDAVDHWTADEEYLNEERRGGSVEMLEHAVSAVSANGMKMRAGTGRLPIVIVPQDTKAGDCIVWLRQTSLLAVLRPADRGRFRVVGEVVDTPERLGLSDRRDGHAETPWKQITLI